MSGDSPGLPETENPISSPLLPISDYEFIKNNNSKKTDGKVDHSEVWSPCTNCIYIRSAYFITGLCDKRSLY